MSTQPYPDSYYAATRHEDPGYPALAEDIETDVCICGGGFTGIATALSLSLIHISEPTRQLTQSRITS